jgi:glycine/D-amino acid oxidase-like deaminating enzyme
MIVVVGAGIVGASVTYHLARAGAEVTLVDQSLPGTGVTGDSFGWIGGPGGGDHPDASIPMRRTVMADYRRLQRELQLPVRWTGSLTLDPVSERQDLGPDERLVDPAEVTQLEPRLRTPTRALYKTSDGVVDPIEVAEALVRGGAARGAEVMLGVGVVRLRLRGRDVIGVDTSNGFVPGRTVVVAAGVQTPAFCASVGVDLPVSASPSLLARFTGPPGLVRTLVKAPEIEVRQAPDDVLVAALEYGGEVGRADLLRTGRSALSRLHGLFDGAEEVRLLGVRVGMRPVPRDGLPIVGPLPGVGGVYVAVMHSGVTLAPVVGRLVAQEIAGGTVADELQGLRPDRTLSGK